MNKKGFTLVELLAVIAILAILVIIALPNVMSLFNEAKKNSFANELKEIFSTAEKQYMTESFSSNNELLFAREGGIDATSCSGTTTSELKLSGRTTLKYAMKLNRSGEVVNFVATDGTFAYYFNNTSTPLKIESIGSGTASSTPALTDANVIITLADLNPSTAVIKCDGGVFKLSAS